MRWRRVTPPTKISVMCGAARAIESAGSACLPQETGGILLGWRTPTTVHVERAVEVVDDQATSTTYERDHERSEAALAAALKDEPAGSPVGYVGEWHTHPGACGPSAMDRGALGRIATRRGAAPIALLVPAWQQAGACQWHGRIGLGKRAVHAEVEVFEHNEETP